MMESTIVIQWYDECREGKRGENTRTLPAEHSRSIQCRYLLPFPITLQDSHELTSCALTMQSISTDVSALCRGYEGLKAPSLPLYYHTFSSTPPYPHHSHNSSLPHNTHHYHTPHSLHTSHLLPHTLLQLLRVLTSSVCYY